MILPPGDRLREKDGIAFISSIGQLDFGDDDNLSDRIANRSDNCRAGGLSGDSGDTKAEKKCNEAQTKLQG